MSFKKRHVAEARSALGPRICLVLKTNTIIYIKNISSSREYKCLIQILIYIYIYIYCIFLCDGCYCRVTPLELAAGLGHTSVVTLLQPHTKGFETIDIAMLMAREQARVGCIYIYIYI
jgi:hypothetical protein